MTQYTGESGYTCYTRMVSHKAGLQSEDHHSALWQHAVDRHGVRKSEGRQIKIQEMFKAKVTGTYKTSARRLISEACRIEESVQLRDLARGRGEGEEREVLNSARQWFQPGLIKVKASKIFSYGDR